MAVRTDGYGHGAFGLRIWSAFDLPELPRLAPGGFPADVSVERARIPAALEGATRLDAAMQVTPDAFQLDVPAGRFAVREGRRILVDPASDASEADLRPYLLGSVMGGLCHQRALLPLHAAGVLIRGRAAAFAGPSGAGKSTLAARFQARGYDVVGDDLLAIDVDSTGSPRALQGAARIRLRIESAGYDGPPAADRKQSFPITRSDPAGAWPLWRFYLLRTVAAGPPTISRRRGPEAVSAIVGQVYRWPIAAAMGRGDALFAQCLHLARRCEVFEVAFTHAADSPASLAESLERHLGQ